MTIAPPFTIGASSRSSALLFRVITAAANDTATNAAMCGRTIPAVQRPTPQMMSPRHVAYVRILAAPYAAIPRLNIIHASLPMLDGQKTSDGRKKSRRA